MSTSVSILGPINYTQYQSSDGQVKTRYTGICQTAYLLAHFLNNAQRIHPVSNIRRQDRAAMQTLFGQHSEIDWSGLCDDFNRGSVIHQEERIEAEPDSWQLGFMQILMPKDIAPFIGSDVFLLAPDLQQEVPVETVRYIRHESREKALTVLDSYGMHFTLSAAGDRLERFWAERDLWLPQVDVLVLYEELLPLTWYPNAFTDVTALQALEALTPHEAQLMAEHILHMGPKVIFLNLNIEGTLIFTLDANGYAQSRHIRPKELWKEAGDEDQQRHGYLAGLSYSLLMRPTNYSLAAETAELGRMLFSTDDPALLKSDFKRIRPVLQQFFSS